MNQRILFMIIGDEVKYLANSNMDHKEWYLSLGLDEALFEDVVRGYIIDDKIVYFKGINFNYDDEVIKAAKKYSAGIKLTLNNPNLLVCCGIVINSYGEKWEPIMTIKDEELQGTNTSFKNDVKVEVKEVKTSSGHMENGPIIELKNDYNDKKFVKYAILVTIGVLIFNIFIKIFLFGQNKVLHVSRFGDVFLVLIQFILLVMTIIGYIQKKDSTKYLGIAASISIILTFDIFDIIVGVLYFLFNIDFNYFKNGYSLIRKLVNKRKER